MGSVTAQLQLLQQLEGQLLKLRKEKSFTDPALRDVRKQFRATAEAILLKNYRIAMVCPYFKVKCLYEPDYAHERESVYHFCKDERILHCMRKGRGLSLALTVGKKLGDKAVAPLLSQTCSGVPASHPARARCKGRESQGKPGKGQISLPFAVLASLLLPTCLSHTRCLTFARGIA